MLNFLEKTKHTVYFKTGLAKKLHQNKFKTDKNLLFIWIPKCAGTSLFDKLQNNGFYMLKSMLQVKYVFTQQGYITFCHIDYNSLVSKGFVSENFDTSAYKFTFCRNPYDRAVSLFFYLKNEIVNRTNNDFDFLTFCKLLDKEGCEPVGLYNTKGLSQCNPQVEWIKNIKIDFIGKVENIQDNFNQLTSTLNLPIEKLGRENTTKRKSYKNYYCKESKKIIDQFYREDFEYFNYPMEL